MTRILALSLRYPPHHTGGYELSTRDLLEVMAARGHDVEVLVSDLRVDGVEDPPGEEAANPSIRRVLRPYFRDEDLYRPSVFQRWRIERSNLARLREAIDRFEPDVVSPWQMSALSMGMLTVLVESGLPLVYVISDDWLSYGEVVDAWADLFRRRRRLGAAVRPLVGVPTTVPDLGTSGRFLFNSHVMRDRSERYSRWTFPDHDVVYVPLDTRRYPIADYYDDRPWRGSLLYAGRLDPRKGIETAVRAMGAISDARLEVRGTGDPEYGRELLGIAAELGIEHRVRIEPPLQDGLRERYVAADAVVFPSEWEEPFGLVPVEAMACGTPVVATGVGGSGEFLIHEENCLLSPPGDAEALARALERLRDDRALRRRLATGGLETARRFALERIADVFEPHYEALARR